MAGGGSYPATSVFANQRDWLTDIHTSRFPADCESVFSTYAICALSQLGLSRVLLEEFVAFYYNTFDSGRQGLATLYVCSRIPHSSPES